MSGQHSVTENALPLRDRDIREPLHHWLEAKYAQKSETEILHELKMPRPSARIDVAVVNGSLCGYEIKSDVDNFARLDQQKAAFAAVFDKVSIVTTIRHLDRAERVVPKWWGIVVATVTRDGIRFRAKRTARLNHLADLRPLLYMLTRSELVRILNASNFHARLSRRGLADLIDFIVDNVSAKEIRSRVRDILRERPTYAYGSSPLSSK